MLEDTGERDEYGMEPVDNIFSSPEKETNGRTFGSSPAASDDEQDMEIDEGMRAFTLRRRCRANNVLQRPLWDPRQ